MGSPSKTTFIWIAFGACLAVVLTAMVWISMTVVRLEAEQQAAQRQAVLGENSRLALWRMDSTLLWLIGRETARPSSAYTPTRHAWDVRNLSESTGTLPEPVRSPSRAVPQFVHIYFHYDAAGELTSPQTALPLGEPAASNPEIERRLKQLAQFVNRDALLAKLPEEFLGQEVLAQQPQADINEEPRQSPVAQQKLNLSEFQSRAKNTAILSNGLPSPYDPPQAPGIQVGVLTPLWIGNELLLARRVAVGGEDLVQGLWLDWDEIRRTLSSDVRDLLPNADLQPVVDDVDGNESRMLTTIPARLVPGPLAVASPTGSSVITITLVLAWISTLAAAAVGAALLFGVISLSNRRSAFVSAVTHELRTPLTTFQLYTEMLDDGFVSDEKKQKSYLQTLRAEAGRLSHLVENVLAYAQLERSGTQVRLENIGISELMDRVRERLQQRAQQAEMQFDVDCDPGEPRPKVRVDPSAVERILFNLVDNACKYASDSERKSIELSCRRTDSAVEIRVRDHGPGTGGRVGRSLFQPFSKSATEAARTKPGIGLGLSLSRRLARDLGGDLRHDETITDGACFVLTLPIVENDGAVD